MVDDTKAWVRWRVALAGACFLSPTLLGAQSAVVLGTGSPLDSVVSPVAHSGFRLLGRITQMGAVTTATIAPSFRTVRFLVDSALSAPRSIRPLAGRHVTLILSDTLGVIPQAQYVVLASGVQFDTGVVLREEGRFRLGAGGSLPGVVALIARADSAISSRVIAQRGSSAAAVIVGRVTSISTDSSPRAVAGRPASNRGEHQPVWRIAMVRVGTQILPVSRSLPSAIRVLFAAGTDALFASTPRLAAGDSVILMLRSASEILPRMLPLGVDTAGLFLVFHPLDRQPPERQALVTWALR